MTMAAIDYAGKTVVGPQEGPQTMFVTSQADITFFGGSAGGGKSFGLLIDPLQWVDRPHIIGFTATIFRRNSTMIRNPGGLWDESMEIYGDYDGADPKESVLEWNFPKYNAVIKFSHLEHEKTKFDWHGAQLAMIGFDEVTEFCCHPDTECLTSTGWKLIKDVRVGESVASLNRQGFTEYRAVTATSSRQFDGELVVVDQTRRGISFKVTPNHKCVVSVQDAKRTNGTAFLGWDFQRADQLKGSYVPRTGKWLGIDLKSFKPHHKSGQGYGTNANEVNEIDMELWAEFLGWYMSEGSKSNLEKRGASVHISQTKPEGKVKIKALLDKLGWRYRDGWKGDGYTIGSHQLWEMLPNGNCKVKRVPRYMMLMSPRIINAFLEAFADGDACRSYTGGWSVALANSGLIDDLQELCFLAGRVASRTGEKTGVTKSGKKVSWWCLGVKKPSGQPTQISPKQIKRETYSGPVVCLTVEGNHNFLARYKGGYFWTGNSQTQFFYLLTRARSKCGIRPYVRATCNPDADSWVAEFISWWIDQRTGYAIPERAGVLRWFLRVGDKLFWANHSYELKPELLGLPAFNRDGKPLNYIPQSVTFIPSSLFDNKILMDKDPGYLSKLLAQPNVERERLLAGNWKIKPAAGLHFNRGWVEVVDAVPAGTIFKRGYDLAATEKTQLNDPDFTSGTKIGKAPSGVFYVVHNVRVQWSSGKVKTLLKNTASQDGIACEVNLPQDPGQAGKSQVLDYVQFLSGYNVRFSTETGDKVTRFGPFSSQAQAGNVKVLRGDWNDEWFAQLEGFPELPHDDDADSTSRAFNAFLDGTTGIIEAYEIWAQKVIADKALRDNPPEPSLERDGVLVLPPLGSSVNSLYDMRGKPIPVRPDGSFLVHPEHAMQLRRAGFRNL